MHRYTRAVLFQAARQQPPQRPRKAGRSRLFHAPTARASASSKSLKPKPGDMAPNIGVILGTMTFGWSYSSSTIDSKLAGDMLDAYFAAGYDHVDTALTYSGGKTEGMLGELMPPGSGRAAKCGVLATKAGPWQGTATMSGNCGLSPEQLRAKVQASLAALKRDKIDLLYLHAPDSGTSIEETLAEVHRLHSEGKIGALGLSNFQAWEVCHVYHTCKANGYLLPTVYQGMYNAVTREVERELLPCLRKVRGIAVSNVCCPRSYIRARLLCICVATFLEAYGDKRLRLRPLFSLSHTHTLARSLALSLSLPRSLLNIYRSTPWTYAAPSGANV